MPLIPGCDTPIRSTTDLTMWWAAVLSPDNPNGSMSMMWLDRHGRMRGRILCVTGMPDRPQFRSLQPLLDFDDRIVAAEPEAAGHIAFLLSRKGEAGPDETDEEWAEVLELELDDRSDGSWSFHVAAAGEVTPVRQPVDLGLRSGRIGRDLFAAALALNGASDHNSGHDDAVASRDQGALQSGD